MAKLNCKNCGSTIEIRVDNPNTSVECEICHHVIKVPSRRGVPVGFCRDIAYKSDGITPDFDALFAALAKYEREAPPVYHN